MSSPVGYGLAFPFRVEGGGLQPSTSPDPADVTPAQIREVISGYLEQLALTGPLEIPYRPEFFNPAHTHMFGVMEDSTADAIIFGIKQAVATNIPMVEVTDFDFTVDQAGKVFVELSVSVIGVPDPMSLSLPIPASVEGG